MKTLTSLSLAVATLVTLAAVQPALAGVSAGKAVTACKTEVTARFGKDAITKVHRIRSGKVTRVSLYVRGVSDKTFKIECKIDGKQHITGFVDSREEASLASR
jgi:hypothetical protein